MDKKITFKDMYSFPGFRALARLKPHSEHPGAMIVTLKRRQKKRFALVARHIAVGMTNGEGLSETLVAVILLSTWSLIFAGLNVLSAKP